MSKTRKRNHWRGWKQSKPGYHEKTMMLQRCGKRCFLGTKKSFPICTKHTCKINQKGLYAAYIRSRQRHKISSKYRTVSSKAKKLLRRMGENV